MPCLHIPTPKHTHTSPKAPFGADPKLVFFDLHHRLFQTKIFPNMVQKQQVLQIPPTNITQSPLQNSRSSRSRTPISHKVPAKTAGPPDPAHQYHTKSPPKQQVLQIPHTNITQSPRQNSRSSRSRPPISHKVPPKAPFSADPKMVLFDLHHRLFYKISKFFF